MTRRGVGVRPSIRLATRGYRQSAPSPPAVNALLHGNPHLNCGIGTLREPSRPATAEPWASTTSACVAHHRAPRTATRPTCAHLEGQCKHAKPSKPMFAAASSTPSPATLPATPRTGLQDTICQCWEMLSRYAERGVDLEPAILVQFCGTHAQDLSRHFVHDGSHKKRDAYDPRNRLSGRVSLVDVDEVDPVGLAEVDCFGPGRKIISAHDLDRWLKTLPDRDREMLALRRAGHTWQETAEAVGIAMSTVRQRCGQLGLDLARRGGVEIGHDAEADEAA